MYQASQNVPKCSGSFAYSPVKCVLIHFSTPDNSFHVPRLRYIFAAVTVDCLSTRRCDNVVIINEIHH